MSRNVDRYFEDNKPFVGLQRSSLRSGVTYVAARGINIFVQLASTVVLARLLGPHDFGLVAIVLALVGFAPMLIDLGTTEASIQKTQISEVEISSLFWLNVAISVLLTVLLAAGSGVIARMFGEPLLAGIALVLSATFVMAALSTQHYALMRRAMQFRRIATIDISANVVGSVVSVVLALTGWGYWALVAKPLVTSVLAAVGVWISCRWVPGRPRVTPDVRELVRFGLGVTGFTMTDYLARAGDRIAIGYFYGPGPLGYFQNAFTIYSNLLSILTEPLHNIAVSGLSKLRNDADQLKRAWATALSSLSFFSAPAFALLAVTGQDLVVVLLGPKWAPAGPLLCIFAVRGIAHSVERSLGWVHVAVGRSDRWMRWGLVSALVQLAALAAGLPFGVIGVATTYAIVTFGLFIPALVYAGRPVGIGYDDVLRAVGPQTIAGLSAAAVGFGIQEMFLADHLQLIRVSISGAVCLGVYFTVVVGVFKMTGPIRLALSVLGEYAARRSPARS
ncbi:MAG: lipopolysaccharide biosynthesis protein [Rhodopseudomonas sp.]|nr:lipopolysaccharide biosynthesis protein [Rhodopseudomonas sp.]